MPHPYAGANDESDAVERWAKELLAVLPELRPVPKRLELNYLVLDSIAFCLRRALPEFACAPASLTADRHSVIHEVRRGMRRMISDPRMQADAVGSLWLVGLCITTAQGRLAAALDRSINAALVSRLETVRSADENAVFFGWVGTRLELLKGTCKTKSKEAELLGRVVQGFMHMSKHGAAHHLKSSAAQRRSLVKYDRRFIKQHLIDQANSVFQTMKSPASAATCLAMCCDQHNRWKHRPLGTGRNTGNHAWNFAVEWMWCYRALGVLAELFRVIPEVRSIR